MNTRECSLAWAARLRSSAVEANVRRALWGDGPHLFLLLRLLAKHFSNYRTFIDIGAADYAGLRPVDLWRDPCSTRDVGPAAFRRLWKSSTDSDPVTVHAFEPTVGTPLDKIHGIHIHRAVVSNHSGELAMYGTGATATTNARLLVHPRWQAARLLRRVNTTTIDALTQRQSIKHVDVLKIDAEGVEWEVLLGSGRLLAHQRISVILFEYSLSWSASTYFSAYPMYCNTRRVRMSCSDAKELNERYQGSSAAAMEQPTLHSVTRFLSAKSYNAYLVGSTPPASGTERQRELQFVPLSVDHWDDAFELGFKSRSAGMPPPYAWYDVVAVRADSAEDAQIKSIACSAASEAGIKKMIKDRERKAFVPNGRQKKCEV